MKTQLVSSGCLVCMLLLAACQKQEFNASHSVKQGGKTVAARDGQCDHCDILEDCCCSIQLDEDDAATIRICGTTDGMLACSGSTAPCNYSISGGGQAISLSTITPKKVFCMNALAGLRIVNVSGSDNAGIII